MLTGFRIWIGSKKNEIKLRFGTLFYNHFCDWNYAFDTALTPMFWIVDNYAGKLGQAFVIMCCLLMAFVACVSYWIGLPYWWNKSQVTTVFLLIIGHWLLINCVFHYYMGVKCSPGFPPQDRLIEEVASICKKCIHPKPHRTHHCSICNTCILQMDHHCPWLNNCVGHFNRRYFLMFMVYIEMSVIFLITFGVEIAYMEIWLNNSTTDDVPELYGYSVEVNTSLPKENWIVKPSGEDADAIISQEKYKSLRKKAILCTAIICLGVSIAIGTLLYGHCRMISKGETSIERHINNAERKKYAARNEVYVNPYDFGVFRNWIIFLGIYNGSKRSWFHVIFPSSHKPFGNGMMWPTIRSTELEWKTFFHEKY